MIANIAEIKLQAITAKSIAAENVLRLQGLVIRPEHGKMVNRLREIGHGLVIRLRSGEKQYIKETTTHVSNATLIPTYTLIILFGGLLMKVKGLMLATGLHFAGIVTELFTGGVLLKKIKNFVSVESRLKEKVNTAVRAQQSTNGKNGIHYND